mmetsp:Transcript_11366/g.35002  ORF Transcript_11366/g.35002 Transcript_11366/m.35002 type:complete len:253 (+) Transcript_11366:137-895(+)
MSSRGGSGTLCKGLGPSSPRRAGSASAVVHGFGGRSANSTAPVCSARPTTWSTYAFCAPDRERRQRIGSSLLNSASSSGARPRLTPAVTRSMNASSDCHLPRVSWSASRFARRSAFRTRSSAASSASAGAYAPCGAMHVWRCGVMKSKMCVHASRIRISDGTWSSKGRCACRVRGSAERKSSCFTSRKTTTRPALGRTAKSRSGNQSSPPVRDGAESRKISAEKMRGPAGVSVCSGVKSCFNPSCWPGFCTM